MAEIGAEPGFAAAARAEIGEMIGDLPHAVRATLMPDADAADALADGLAKSGARRVMARMKGAEG
jgi:Holliday junction resolvasome RuvABC endonuclease subunit